MDYPIFLTGLFLLISALGSLFHFQKDRLPTRWPLFAVALATLGLKLWLPILAFAFAPGDWVTLADTLLGTVYATALLGFTLSPLVGQKTSVFVAKFAAMIAMFAHLFIVGAKGPPSLLVVVPLIAVSFAGGWKSATSGNKLSQSKRILPPWVAAVLLSAVAAVAMIPDAVQTTFDIEGRHFSNDRIMVLSALAAGTICSIALCVTLWRIIYQDNRRQLSRSMLRRRRISTTAILLAAAFTAVNGAWLAHWLGNQVSNEQTSTLLSALRLGANHIDPVRIQSLKGTKDEIQTKDYAAMRSTLLEVREALPQNRFTYIIGKRNGKTVFLVDAADPGNSADFSPPGQVVEGDVSKWDPAFKGRSIFIGPYKDAWGVWFTAVAPIFDARGRPVALLNVDYDASLWLQPMAGRRIAAMGVTLSVAALLVVLFAFHLISIETARRVESLSERLSDAMTAAEFDTWEYFPKSFQLNVGERISSTLGLSGSSLPLRTLWRHTHPEDRRQLFDLARERESSEAEVRFKDTTGRWLWFMLRGRVVQSHPDDPLRLVGTILNIDDRQRSRLEIDRQRRFAQQVMNSVPNGLAVITADGVVSYANPAFARLVRSGPRPLEGVPLASLVENATLSPTSGGAFEAMLNCFEGNPVPVQVYQAPLDDARRNDGSILAIVDLSSAKEAERDLLRSRAEAKRLALVAKRTDNAVVITDATGHIEWVNEGFTKISGYTRDEVIGKIPGAFLQHADENPPAKAYMSECVKAGKGFETEILNYHKSGRAYIVHIECQPLVDSKGILTGFMAIQRDITHTRRTSHLLEAVSSISTTLLSERIGSSVWSTILKALGTAANVDNCRLMKCHPFSGSDLLHVSEIASWSAPGLPENSGPALVDRPFEKSPYDRWYRELGAGREIHGLVSTFPEGERPGLEARKIISIIVVPIMVAEKLWGFLGLEACNEERVWEDWEISLLRSAAANIGLRQVAQNESDALVLARDEARNAAIAADKANLAKGTFLATMSHEIRTPLNAVIGMASLLETTSLNAQQKDFTGTILNSGNFLLELINDILDYSRIENGHIDLDNSPFVLPEVCREAFDVVRVGVAGKEIELIARIEPSVPHRLTGDRARIRQILVNLLGNAVKFTAHGFVSLTVDGTLMPDGRWMLTFEVRDSGIGISPEALTRLFRPFTQEDSTTTRRFGGSGLGLAISKRLAEQMGGDITVDSLSGRGSTFVASLLLESAAPDTGSAPPAPEFPVGKIPRILIVDDNPINRRILEETLANWGLACHSAEGGSEAIQTWNLSGPYDLVITDQHMPEMDGVDLTRYLRTLPQARNTRFILLSSESNCPSDIRALYDVVGSKPIWPSSLHDMISRQFPGGVPESNHSAQTVNGSDSQRLSDLKVLVAEDNLNNQKVIRLLLKRLGIEADIVSDGSQAVDAATAREYDVILLDLQMPVMDGLQASRSIRLIPLQKRPHLVALTANVFQEDRDAASAAGMDDYLAKPITLDRLRDMLTTVATTIHQQD
ncbi:response regulator [Luteolibacter yonseiensis]|uniref:histidine kinase n=1 Tax=Luteolibacter yonseiensis TaxID=1144680 RepID=A0A934R873_9BACT|nr:response regulator [Luteolibacter yonseiensis]MBK1817966.1 response regulator [Luteolibacter yonseiensis]